MKNIKKENKKKESELSDETLELFLKDIKMNKERNKDISNYFDFKISKQYIKNKKRKKKLENFYKQNQYALNNNSLKNIQFISSNSKDNSNDNSEIQTFNNNNIERNIPFIEKENVTPKNLFSEKKKYY